MSLKGPQELAFLLGLTDKASNLGYEQRQLLREGVQAILLLLAVRRAKNKRRSPGHPDSQPPECPGVLHTLLPPPAAPTPCRVLEFALFCGTRLPKEGPFLRWNHFIFTP